MAFKSQYLAPGIYPNQSWPLASTNFCTPLPPDVLPKHTSQWLVLHPSTTYHEYEGVHLSETTPFGRTVLLKIAKDGYFPLSAVYANITVERDFSCQDVGIDCFHDYRVNGPIVVQIYIECLKCMIDVPICARSSISSVLNCFTNCL